MSGYKEGKRQLQLIFGHRFRQIRETSITGDFVFNSRLPTVHVHTVDRRRYCSYPAGIVLPHIHKHTSSRCLRVLVKTKAIFVSTDFDSQALHSATMVAL